MAASPPEWKGRTVVCIASGPSLTAEDCEVVRGSGHPAIVTNTTFRLVPWADVLYGFDSAWWRIYLAEVRKVFNGRLFSPSQIAANMGIETTYGATWCRAIGNSGASAISVAVGAGASRVVLLGYDCGLGPDGARHWHGDHPRGLTNCPSMGRWSGHFKMAARLANRAGSVVVNASRATALEMFERVDIEAALR